jgi:AcrR family transcriptional regulator
MARPRTRSDEEILAATLRAVGENGVARLTLAHVACAAGLAPSTLAERFGSKRALLLAAARSAAARVEPLEPLVDGLAALASGLGDRRAFAHHLSLLELDVADPEFRAAAAVHAGAMHHEIRAGVVRAIDAGELVDAADPDGLARALHVAYNGSLLLWGVTGDGEPADALRTDLEAVLTPWRT